MQSRIHAPAETLISAIVAVAPDSSRSLGRPPGLRVELKKLAKLPRNIARIPSDVRSFRPLARSSPALKYANARRNREVPPDRIEGIAGRFPPGTRPRGQTL